MRSIACSALVGSFQWITVFPPRVRQYGTTKASPGALPDLASHCALIQKVMDSSDGVQVKRRRIRGIVEKIEANYIHWLHNCGVKESKQLLISLTKSVRYLERRQQNTVHFERRENWSGASPYFSTAVSDWLCVLLERCVRQASCPEEYRALLSAAAALELSDTQTLCHLCRQLTVLEYTSAASVEEVVDVLHFISLLVKRCRMPIPQLNNLLLRLPAAPLSARQSLVVLSSLLRLRRRNSDDVVCIVSRRAAESVATYTARDVIYALEAIALLDSCHEKYAGAVLNRCTTLCPVLKPADLGSICKYVALLNTSRYGNDTALSCASQLRRLLPALLERTEALLGRFSVRDAHYVLRCLEQHKVHHSVVFSRLSPLVCDSQK
ncbi:hypothetical protein ERJ75_000712900 [Trypanosoma vivax]|uniref:Uncharacterized protein n=1 Tax=Trypanosoma vivax (strain Y486) TaxID=1055687 RepID=G0TTU4_TRYVY|nr:hypothetical protein TRVL_00053 [Trypanosoma vivax]KAH8614148.1 hypothetical protein ERJ75_000712900 [Trypanosoma vivax]CCC47376.1 conserved hypothetical protein [Trypanosoma vivax Y486]